MSEFLNILAAKDSDNLGRILGIVIVVVIAIINMIASAVKRRQEQRHREEARAQIERNASKPPVPLPARTSAPQPQYQSRPDALAAKLARRDDMKRAVQQAQPPRRSQRVVKQPSVKTAPAPAVIAPVEVQRSVPLTRVAEPAAARPNSVAVDARALSRWLNPATMRQQFILTEILQPPLASRENYL